MASNKSATKKTTIQVNETSNFAKFFVIQNKDDNGKRLSDLSPFVVEKVLHGTIGETNSVKKMRQGCLLVEI